MPQRWPQKGAGPLEGGRVPEALKRYKNNGFCIFSRRPELPGLRLQGTILGPDLVPVYTTARA